MDRATFPPPSTTTAVCKLGSWIRGSVQLEIFEVAGKSSKWPNNRRALICTVRICCGVDANSDRCAGYEQIITTRALENIFLPAAAAKVEDSTFCGKTAQLLTCQRFTGWINELAISGQQAFGVKSQEKNMLNEAVEKSRELKYTALGRIGPECQMESSSKAGEEFGGCCCSSQGERSRCLELL